MNIFAPRGTPRGARCLYKKTQEVRSCVHQSRDSYSRSLGGRLFSINVGNSFFFFSSLLRLLEAAAVVAGISSGPFDGSASPLVCGLSTIARSSGLISLLGTGLMLPSIGLDINEL